MKYKPAKPRPLTDEFYSRENKFWRFGVRLWEWGNNPGVPVLNIYRMRRRRDTKEWIPQTNRQIHVPQFYWKDLFGKGGIIEQAINSYLNSVVENKSADFYSEKNTNINKVGRN